MIIVAMISVLAAVAIPSYQNYIQKILYESFAAATIHKDGSLWRNGIALMVNTQLAVLGRHCHILYHQKAELHYIE